MAEPRPDGLSIMEDKNQQDDDSPGLLIHTRKSAHVPGAKQDSDAFVEGHVGGEAEDNERRATMRKLEHDFCVPRTESEEQDIPDELLLCLNCRDPGHIFRDCTLPLQSALEYPVAEASYIPAIIGVSKKVLSLPSRIALEPRKVGDTSLPCPRCQKLPILDLLTPAAFPEVSTSTQSSVSSPVKTSSGLTYIKGAIDSTMLDMDTQSASDIAMIEGLTGQSKWAIGNTCSMLKVNLGWATTTIFQQDCPLCVALVNSMPNNLHSRDAYIVLCSVDGRERYLKGYSRGVKTEGNARCLFALLHNDLADDEETWAYMDMGRISDAHDAIQLVRPAPNESRADFGGGRLVSEDGIDVEHATSWINRCADHHWGTCQPVQSEKLDRIRLVDVVERKLVNYKDVGSPEYVALSYVWGPGAQPEFSRGFTIPPLPATLEHAITLVQKLGAKYIWIDSVCINQQDPNDKDAQVQIMDAIYTGAWLTVVPMSSESMDSGMPGFGSTSKNSTQIRCQFGDDVLVSTGQTLRQQISDSRWGTRAWTYQEALLSPRCLYIAEEQMYFECNSATSCEAVEDAVSPYHALDTSTPLGQTRAGAHNLNFRNPFIGLGHKSDLDDVEDWTTSLFTDHTGNYLSHYVRQLKQYSQRQMTWDSDSINAFGGMLKQFAKLWFPEGFFQGLPIEHLSTCLMWEHSGQRRRREGFPGWSWAGWEGALSRVCSLEEQNMDLPLIEALEWQKPLFRAYRAVGGQLEMLFQSSSTKNTLEGWRYTVTGQRDRLAELSSAGQLGSSAWDEAFARIMRETQSLVQAEQETTTNGDPLASADVIDLAALPSQSTKSPGHFERSELPLDPFWDLAQSPCPDLEFSTDKIDTGERMSHLFVDCLTITLQIDITDLRYVELAGTKCGIQWYSSGLANRLMNNVGQSDFIVLARNSGTLQLLMVDIDGQVATEVAPATLRLPKKSVERNAQIGSPDLFYQRPEERGRHDGSENWENDNFHGTLIAEGAQPRRRRLVLV